MRKKIDWIILIMWVIAGILLIGKEVPKVTFYCCLLCLIFEKKDQIITRE